MTVEWYYLQHPPHLQLLEIQNMKDVKMHHVTSGTMYSSIKNNLTRFLHITVSILLSITTHMSLRALQVEGFPLSE